MVKPKVSMKLQQKIGQAWNSRLAKVVIGGMESARATLSLWKVIIPYSFGPNYAPLFFLSIFRYGAKVQSC